MAAVPGYQLSVAPPNGRKFTGKRHKYDVLHRIPSKIGGVGVHLLIRTFDAVAMKTCTQQSQAAVPEAEAKVLVDTVAVLSGASTEAKIPGIGPLRRTPVMSALRWIAAWKWRYVLGHHVWDENGALVDVTDDLQNALYDVANGTVPADDAPPGPATPRERPILLLPPGVCVVHSLFVPPGVSLEGEGIGASFIVAGRSLGDGSALPLLTLGQGFGVESRWDEARLTRLSLVGAIERCKPVTTLIACGSQRRQRLDLEHVGLAGCLGDAIVLGEGDVSAWLDGVRFESIGGFAIRLGDPVSTATAAPTATALKPDAIGASKTPVSPAPPQPSPARIQTLPSRRVSGLAERDTVLTHVPNPPAVGLEAAVDLPSTLTLSHFSWVSDSYFWDTLPAGAADWLHSIDPVAWNAVRTADLGNPTRFFGQGLLFAKEAPDLHVTLEHGWLKTNTFLLGERALVDVSPRSGSLVSVDVHNVHGSIHAGDNVAFVRGEEGRVAVDSLNVGIVRLAEVFRAEFAAGSAPTASRPVPNGSVPGSTVGLAMSRAPASSALGLQGRTIEIRDWEVNETTGLPSPLPTDRKRYRHGDVIFNARYSKGQPLGWVIMHPDADTWMSKHVTGSPVPPLLRDVRTNGWLQFGGSPHAVVILAKADSKWGKSIPAVEIVPGKIEFYALADLVRAPLQIGDSVCLTVGGLHVAGSIKGFSKPSQLGLPYSGIADIAVVCLAMSDVEFENSLPAPYVGGTAVAMLGPCPAVLVPRQPTLRALAKG